MGSFLEADNLHVGEICEQRRPSQAIDGMFRRPRALDIRNFRHRHLLKEPYHIGGRKYPKYVLGA